ncbi:MAG: flavodoxin [Eubacteriales bacterium]|nr:flavodoxin [Eubacteriales bacterium]
MKKILFCIISLSVCVSTFACIGLQKESTLKLESSDNKTLLLNSVKEEETMKENDTLIIKKENNTNLVVYFSCTGNTKAIAQKISTGLNADLFEIVPREAYTSADLNYSNNNSRSSKEMNNASSRPEIANKISNISQYDTIYIGYPIWWGEAPRIMNTFVESYSFTNKTIIPFCTSGSSGIGSSATRLFESIKDIKLISGKRFSGRETDEEVMNWLNTSK